MPSRSPCSPPLAKSDWQIYTAALLQSTSTTTRDLLIQGVYNYASGAKSANTEPLGDWYDTVTGLINGFRARPVVGGHLALVSFSRRFSSALTDLHRPARALICIGKEGSSTQDN
jgi:hypothetical protein